MNKGGKALQKREECWEKCGGAPDGACSNMACRTSISEALGNACNAVSMGEGCWGSLQHPYLE